MIYSVLILSLVISSGSVLCEDPGDEEATTDIPVVEGTGGTITTAVEDDVLVLTHENFDLQVMTKKIILVEFYAPWCGHCKHLAPEYAEAAKLLKQEDPPIPLAKVDATVETDLATKYGVTGYPTLFVFKDGIKYPYEGPRSSMGIVDYMKQLADPNWKPPADAVITLTTENFTDTVNAADIILVEFYAPWCGHCKNLAPEYERAARVLKDLPSPVILAKIDATVEKELGQKYEATGYPTLLIFRKGKQYPYEGPRDERGIISYMKDQAKPVSREVNSFKSMKNSMSKTDVVIIGFFKSRDENLYEQYVESADSMRGKLQFMHTFDLQVANQFGVTSSKIVLYQPEIYSSEYEPSKYEFTDADGMAADIRMFYRDHIIPLVGERIPKNRWLYHDKYPLVVVYFDVDFSFEHRVQTQLIRKEVAKVAKDFKGQITFAVSNEEDYQDELAGLSLDDSGEDVNVAYFASEKGRYRMEPVEDFSADELREFVENVQGGNIPRHIRSQPPPKENKGPVISVVGSTFEELVTQSDKDVLLEFYAPWCGFCKKLEPTFKKLGKMFAENEKIMICKIDAAANDYPEQFEVRGFPTIYYIPASDKTNAVHYEGERDLDDLAAFVNNQLKKGHVKEEL